MRRVVLDPELLAAGLLARDEMHKLLGLFAYGRWTQYAALFGAGEEAVLDEELRSGGLRKGPSRDDSSSLLTIERRRSLSRCRSGHRMISFSSPVAAFMKPSSNECNRPGRSTQRFERAPTWWNKPGSDSCSSQRYLLTRSGANTLRLRASGII